ncbi:sulfite exporter TauE/SafE family protein [Agrococcus sp. Marseille-P2731]|uniref:sulfite exporter TauE/SafE family protein n=1 Tax=Agrococcus sp. Marseille-P2731 TaxID=1841862 RepID=UPI000930B877|nr:sulfite exporter TauE/SafE family protein [Agrococcus sp. Marseille-P2731]
MRGGGRRATAWLVLASLGLAAGFLSGLFGVGGGIVLVPALIALAGMDGRRAAATSLAAIVPTAAAGAVSYAALGALDLVAGGLLALGAVGGAQLGSWLLVRVPAVVGRWLFVAFVCVVIAQLLLTVPTRDAGIALTPWTIAGLVLLGFAVGALSGVLGVGGGVLIVPALMLLFGASDLVAKGTSLLTIVPSAISGTVGNLVRHTVDLPAAIVVGVAACTTSALGAIVAAALSAATATVLFAVFLAGVLAWSVWQSVREGRGR